MNQLTNFIQPINSWHLIINPVFKSLIANTLFAHSALIQTTPKTSNVRTNV